MKMMRIIGMAALLCVGLLAARQAVAEPPKHGLMWHRSGLPAVFPLQVKTLPPQAYFVTLRDVESDAVVLAAYIEGGRFFRVLVPPGTFEVRFDYGVRWQGEEALFGAGTEVFEVPEPLTFGVKNFNTKAGHLLDLRDLSPGQEARVVPEDVFVCQGLRLVSLPHRFGGWLHTEPTGDAPLRDTWRHLFDVDDDPVRRDRWSAVERERPSDVLRYDVRTRPCGGHDQ